MNRETQLAIFSIVASNSWLLTAIVVEGLTIVQNAEAQEGR
jgi:UDP-N-acetylglucosamine enolpyruvyl transferase